MALEEKEALEKADGRRQSRMLGQNETDSKEGSERKTEEVPMILTLITLTKVQVVQESEVVWEQGQQA